MSASQISFDFNAVKSRFTAFAAMGESRFESVVQTQNFLCEIARIPSPFVAGWSVVPTHAPTVFGELRFRLDRLAQRR